MSKEQSEAFLAEHGLTVAENWILRLVELEERPKKDVVGYTLGVFEAAGYRNLPSREELDAALDSLLAKGDLQVIDEESLRAIEVELTRDPALGPAAGLPRIGDVDFTLRAAQYRDSIRPVSYFQRSGVWAWDRTDRHRSFLCRTEEPLLEWTSEGRFTASEPYRVGAWRGRWWRKFPDGFCMDVVYEEE
jgi:hypothetical protein